MAIFWVITLKKAGRVLWSAAPSKVRKSVSLKNWCSIFCLLAAAPAGFASHTTTGNSAYVAELHRSGVIAEQTLTDGVDHYILPVKAGTPVTISVTRGSVGDLVPNVSLFNGVSPAGDSILSHASEVFFPPLTDDNTASPSVSGSFTPTVSGDLSLLVTTWDHQAGTYDLAFEGAAAHLDLTLNGKANRRVAANARKANFKGAAEGNGQLVIVATYKRGSKTRKAIAHVMTTGRWRLKLKLPESRRTRVKFKAIESDGTESPTASVRVVRRKR